MSLFFHQRNEDPTPLKLTRHRRLLIGLIVIMVGLVVVVAWSVWPEQHKDLTLRLKFVRSEVVDGKTKLLFRVEGAERYEIYIKGFCYLHGNDQPIPPFTSDTAGIRRSLYDLNLYNYGKRARQFYADPPRYSPFNDQGWKLGADACVVVQEQDKTFSKLWFVMKNTWAVHQQTHSSIFYAAKSLWKGGNSGRTISEQILTSDVITNCPITQFP